MVNANLPEDARLAKNFDEAKTIAREVHNTTALNADILPNETYQDVAHAAIVYASIAEILNSRRAERGDTLQPLDPKDRFQRAVKEQISGAHVVHIYKNNPTD